MFNLLIAFSCLLICDREPLGEPAPVLLFGNPTLGHICTPEPFHSAGKHFLLCNAPLCRLQRAWSFLKEWSCPTFLRHSTHKPSLNFPCIILRCEGLGCLGFFFIFAFPCKLLLWNKLKYSQGIKVIFIKCVISLGMQDTPRVRESKCSLA